MNRFKNKLFFVFSFAMLLGSFGVAKPSFAAAHPAGTNIVSGGTIYMITDDGQRRPYTSAGAYLSYGFNSWANAVPATSEDMALPQGNFIPPRDGKIVCSDRGADKGTCYLITNGKRAAFTSAQVFTSLGFSFSKALYGDVSFLTSDNDVASSNEQHRAGVLINKSGTIYLNSPAGLLGIPSMDMLKSWGYSLSDVVIANNADLSLSQTAVISSRQGAQLSPNGSSASNNSAPAPQVSEHALLQGYIDTYPDLPSATISDPQNAAQVIDLANKIQAIPGSTVDPIYPYMSSLSVDLFNKAPNFKSYWESPSVHLIGLSSAGSDISVFQGGTQALYYQSEKQTGTGFTDPLYMVFLKENGTWKWDVIATLKYQYKLHKQQNPADAYIAGAGNSDISIIDAVYTDQPMVKDANTWLLLTIKNNGQTTIEKFDLLVRLNSVAVIDETDSYEMKPGQSIILAVPINYYWTLAGTPKNPGQYLTDISLTLGSSATDINPGDNTKNFSTSFQQNNSGIVTF